MTLSKKELENAQAKVDIVTNRLKFGPAFNTYKSKYRRRMMRNGKFVWVDTSKKVNGKYPLWNKSNVNKIIFNKLVGSETPFEDLKYQQLGEEMRNYESKVFGGDAVADIRRKFSPLAINPTNPEDTNYREIDYKRSKKLNWYQGKLNRIKAGTKYNTMEADFAAGNLGDADESNKKEAKRVSKEKLKIFKEQNKGSKPIDIKESLKGNGTEFTDQAGNTKVITGSKQIVDTNIYQKDLQTKAIANPKWDDIEKDEEVKTLDEISKAKNFMSLLREDPTLRRDVKVARMTGNYLKDLKRPKSLALQILSDRNAGINYDNYV